MHLVAALDRIPGIHCVLGLFEGVATGAVDGYARIAQKPAATLLHCGPGLANGLANFHRSSSSAASVGMDAAAAVQAARNASGIATLILPSDTSWGEDGIPAKALPVSPLPTATPPRIVEIARILRSGEPTALVVAGNALGVDG